MSHDAIARPVCRQPVVLDPSVAGAFVALARLFAPFVAAELHANAPTADESWVDQGASPLGRRLHCALARRGVLAARKVGRRWLVRRADLDAFITEHGRAPALAAPVPADSEEDDEMRAVLAEAGLVLRAR